MLRISEIFGPTIQGEGALIGTPTLFVRSGGCDFACIWCDTLYAVDKKYRADWHKHSSQAVLDQLTALSKNQGMWVTLSGGNPALQPFAELIDAGHALGYQFALETQGSICQPWFKHLDALTLSPKPPSSGMAFKPQILTDCIQAAGADTLTTLKIVIDDEADLTWAQAVHQLHPDIALVLQPCNRETGDAQCDTDKLTDKLRWLAEEMNRLQWRNVRVLPQLHVYLWANQRAV